MNEQQLVGTLLKVPERICKDWQGDLVRFRPVELEDWRYFFEWNTDTYFVQTTDSIYFPQSQEKLKKWVAEVAVAKPKNDEYRG